MNIQFQTCAHPKDLSHECEVFVKEWGYWSWEELNNALKTGNYILYCAQLEKQIVAALLVMVAVDIMDVIYIYTHPSHRGKKLALMLLQECERKCKESGVVKRVFLEVRKDNIAAQKLYDAFGMKEINVRTKYYNDGCDALIYSKEV